MTDAITRLTAVYPKGEVRETKNGLLMRCPAPNHKDEHPSFLFSPEKAQGRCYACGHEVFGLDALIAQAAAK